MNSNAFLKQESTSYSDDRDLCSGRCPSLLQTPPAIYRREFLGGQYRLRRSTWRSRARSTGLRMQSLPGTQSFRVRLFASGRGLSTSARQSAQSRTVCDMHIGGSAECGVGHVRSCPKALLHQAWGLDLNPRLIVGCRVALLALRNRGTGHLQISISRRESLSASARRVRCRSGSARCAPFRSRGR
jgi:hypothetical protein